MDAKSVFKRYEMKYILDRDQFSAIRDGMKEMMVGDEYGSSTVRNIYFDTDSYLLIRRSIEKPVYKEKFRLRSYTRVGDDDDIFLELKKKYDGVVYKRRIALPNRVSMDWLCGGPEPDIGSNGTANEIRRFLGRYCGLAPKMFISYDRNAFFDRVDSDLRITFDKNIMWRTSRLDLKEDVGGSNIIDANTTLMEIKTSKGLPMWLTGILSENRIYKSSFSKYGTAYKQMISGVTKMDAPKA